MRWSLAIFCCFLAGVSGYIVKLGTPVVQPKFATSGWLHRQKLILKLFENVCEDSKDPMIVRMASEFSLYDALAKYSKADLVTNFRNLYEGKGLLPKGELVSEYNKENLDELRLIYNILYYANDFDVFYTTAAWARQNVNCGIFIDALYAAIINRRDTEKIAVPAPYEILPQYFIRWDAIAKAILLFKNNDTPLEDIEGVNIEGNVYTVDANYTGAFFDNEEESKISYFREDIGLNTFYYFLNLRNAHWLDRVQDGTSNRGEYWYWIIRQLNARYNLERVTNGLKEIEDLSWRTNIDEAYDPMLMYSNGKFFPDRTNGLNIGADDASYLVDFENHISSMAQQMTNMNKTDLMNTIFDLLNSDETGYDWTARRALSTNVVDDESRLSSALEHYATTLRDPMYWRLNKRLLNAFNVALKTLGPYAHNQLYFPGVEVMNIEVKKMQTYLDYYAFDITDSVTTNAVDNLLHLNIGQPRLNHKPFSITIYVNSLVAQKSLVKIFIGPKFTLADIAMVKDSLKQLDSFEYNLNVGTNAIVRKSDQINNVAEDFPSLRTLMKRVEAAELGLEPLYFTNIESIVGYPTRLILPKGTADGFPLQLYVIIAPFVKTQMNGIVQRDFNTEVLSPGYPFDRPIEDPKVFDLANTMFKEILIVHKGDNKVYNYGGVGASKKWYSTGAGRPAYNPDEKPTYGKKSEFKPYDYSAKKGSYGGKKFDYTAKKGNYEPKSFDYKQKNVITEAPVSIVEPIVPEPELNVLPIEKVNTKEEVINPPLSEISEDSVRSASKESSESRQDTLPNRNLISGDESMENTEEVTENQWHPVLRSGPYDYAAKKEKATKKYLAKKEKQDKKTIKFEKKNNSTVTEPSVTPVESIDQITVIKAVPTEVTVRDNGEFPLNPGTVEGNESSQSSNVANEVKALHPLLRSGPYDFTKKKEKKITDIMQKKEKAIGKHEIKKLKYETLYNRTESPTIDVVNVVPETVIVGDADKFPKLPEFEDDSESSQSSEDSKNWQPILRSGPYDFTKKKEKKITDIMQKKEKAIDKHEMKKFKYETLYNRTESPTVNVVNTVPTAVIVEDEIEIPKLSEIDEDSASSQSSGDSNDASTKDWHPILKSEPSKPYDFTKKKEKKITDIMKKKEKAINEHEIKKVKYETLYNRTELPIVESEGDNMMKDKVSTNSFFETQGDVMRKEIENSDKIKTIDYDEMNRKFNEKVISTNIKDSGSIENVNKYHNIKPDEHATRTTTPVEDDVRYVDEIDLKPIRRDQPITWIGLHHFDDDDEEPVYY